VAFQGRASLPPSGLGYTRPGNDYLAGGSGSGMGTTAQGTMKLGQGLGSLGNLAGDWEPSIWYMFALIIAEMIVFHVIGRVLK
jgi:hypothetical protein